MKKIISGTYKINNKTIAYKKESFRSDDDFKEFIDAVNKYLYYPLDCEKKITVLTENNQKYSANFVWLGLFSYMDLYNYYTEEMSKNHNLDAEKNAIKKLKILNKLSKYIYKVSETIGDVKFYKDVYDHSGYEIAFPKEVCLALFCKATELTRKNKADKNIENETIENDSVEKTPAYDDGIKISNNKHYLKSDEDFENLINFTTKYFEDPQSYVESVITKSSKNADRHATNKYWLGLLAYCDLFRYYEKRGNENQIQNLKEYGKYILAVNKTIGKAVVYSGYECNFPEKLTDMLIDKIFKIANRSKTETKENANELEFEEALTCKRLTYI